MRFWEWVIVETRRRPLVPAAVGLFVGSVAAFRAGPAASAAALGLLLAAFAAGRLVRRPLPMPALVCLAAFLAGAGRMLLAVAPAQAAADRLAGTTGVLSGVCVETGTLADGATYSRSLVSAPGTGLVVLVRKGEGIPYGKRVEIPCAFERPEGSRDPGGYDEASRLASDGVFLKARALGEDEHGDGDAVRNPLVVAGRGVRDAISGIYAALLPAREASLMSGMLLGDVSGMDPADSTAFRMAGLSHLTAVSGSNVAFILAPAALLASRGRMPRRSKAAALALYLGFFGYVTGWEASVTRAILMAAVVLAGGVLLRRSDAPSALAAACAAMLLYDPLTAFDNGFRLSVLATLGLLVLSQPFGRAFHRALRLDLPFRGQSLAVGVVDLLAVTLSAQAAVLPVSLPMSGNLSLAGILSNLPVVPLAEIVTLYGAAAGLLGWLAAAFAGPAVVASPVAHVLAIPLQGLLRFILDVATGTARMSWLRFPVPVRSVLVFLPAFFLLLAVASVPRRDLRRPLAMASAAAAVGAAVLLLVAQAASPDVTVVFADVGQGDLTLLVARDGRTIVVDGGPAGVDGTGEGPFVMEGLLSYYGITRVDDVYLTHGHADHAGGVLWLLDNVSCGTFHVPAGTVSASASDSGASGGAPGTEEGLQLEARLLEAADRAGIPVKEESANDRMELGRFVAVTVLHPDSVSDGAPDTSSDDLNARSLVLRVECGRFSFLVAGDADAATEEALATAPALVDVDLLRVSHHGSAYSTSAAFLSAVTAQVAVVSVGPNLYGHPSPKTLARLDEAGCRTCRTDASGAVLVIVRNGVAKVLPWIRGG